MSGKKKGLGRGLSALFGDDKPKEKPQEITEMSSIMPKPTCPTPRRCAKK